MIALYEVFESTKYVHLLLPYLEGGELFVRIKNKGLYRESDAVPIMRNFLSALSYLHSHGIVHRDLKPENLILNSKTDDTDIRIADFGLATRITDPKEKLYLRCGSPGYVAPELLRDKGYTCSYDVFSAGVIFYVMLTGRPLFKGSSPNDILLKNMNCDYDFSENERFWKNISSEALDLVKKMLAENPEDRISAQDAYNHPWFFKDFSNSENSSSHAV